MSPTSQIRLLTDDPEEDVVNNPSHYTRVPGMEVINVLEAFFSSEPLLWQVGKYLLRAGHKDDTLQDLKKAQWYLNRKINHLEANR